jgi:hypothetical protein
MSRRVALYGFIRKKDGLKIQPRGVDQGICTTFSAGRDSLAVVSAIRSRYFQPNPQDLLRHEEVVSRIFQKQVILPAKFPKILNLDALEHSMAEMEKDLNQVLQRIIYKTEYQIKVFMTEPVVEANPSFYYNAFSKFIMENSSRYQYRHYFPLLTKEGKEAEFVDYAETVVRHISQKLCSQTTYWRGKSFRSEKVLLESFFWVRKHRNRLFEKNFMDLRKFYPNLRFSILGPNPPYNFVQLEFVKTL